MNFFQAAVVSILLYRCTTWTLTKRLEKKLDGNYTRILRAILNKSWRQHPTRHQLYGHLPSIKKTIQVRRNRHAGHCWRSKDELIRDVLLWTPAYGRAEEGRPAQIYIDSYVRIRDVALKTCQSRRMIGRSGVRGSGISVLAGRHDDDDMHYCPEISTPQTILDKNCRLKDFYLTQCIHSIAQVCIRMSFQCTTSHISSLIKKLKIITMIMVIKSHWYWGFPWFSLSICSYHPSLPTGPSNYIQYPHRADVNKFLLDGQHWIVHV